MGRVLASVMALGIVAFASGAPRPEATGTRTTAHAKPALAVRVEGGHLVSADGKPLLLRGVSVSGLEDYAIQGWAWNSNYTAYEPWGGDRPSWPAILRWHANAVRIPLNEASWLGLTTYDHDGKSRQADPGKNYRSTVVRTVQEATDAGLYVILDLHWSGPNVPVPGQPSLVPQTPFESGGAQNPMADLDHSLTFWSTTANTFKGNPAVMFELFNEPYFWWLVPGEFRVAGVAQRRHDYSIRDWRQSLPAAVQLAERPHAADDQGGARYRRHQCNHRRGRELVWRHGRVARAPARGSRAPAGCRLHAYPNPKAPAMPAHGGEQYTYVQDIIAAGIPVIITETGDHNAPGTNGSPFVSAVLPWADRHGVSYLGWTWNAWQNPDNILIRNSSGTPTDGYGRYFHDHLACVAAQSGACP